MIQHILCWSYSFMSKKELNKNLHSAKKKKNDEFYTQLADIEREMKHYKEHFKDKIVFCNCDDPEWSNFWKYFTLNFDFLGLKKLIATHYNENGRSYKLEFVPGDKPSFLPSDTHRRTELQGDGDFRSPEAIEILKEADIVVTNPPREYVAQLIEYDKKFLIIGNVNAITYKEMFPLIKDNKMWLGNGFKAGNAFFKVHNPKDFAKNVYDEATGLVKFRNCHWFTNLDHKKRKEELILYQNYYGNEDKYPKYDNYDAINVDKTKDIPVDYEGPMGVPITFLDKFNPEQFNIVGLTAGNIKGMSGMIPDNGKDGPYINGRLKYGRIIIRRRQ